MFVVFEGIDGSGKTTLSGAVSRLLEDAGVSTHHARPKGELKSKLAKKIRTMARDPRSLTMSPHTELLLYLARDSQMIDTVIRPALDTARVVIADRYVQSPAILCRARGLVPEEDIARAVDVVARGLWPDLVVYCDVDIHTSNLRKKLDKTVNPREPGDFGRKGLRGLGLRRAMRDEYLRMADAEDTWMVVDNVNRSVGENAAEIAGRIVEILGEGEPIPAPAPSDRKGMDPIPAAPSKAARAQDAFYGYLERLESEGQARMALYHARSLDSDRAWAIRERHMEDEPEMVARNLDPISSERALDARRSLADAAPLHVARSLSARWADDHDGAWELRDRLAGVVPRDVGMTMGALDSERAWAMRDRLVEEKEARGTVLAGLKKLDNDRAWRLRDSLGKKKLDWALVEGLAAIDTERAWKIRRKHSRSALPWVILSLSGIDGPEAWDIRRRHLDQATKLVVRSLSGLETDDAWDMRDSVGKWAKECLTTIKGSDHPRAWRLREDLMDTWPQFAAKSVGMTLAATERGAGFLWEAAARHPENPEVAHYVVKMIEASPDSDDDDDD